MDEPNDRIHAQVLEQSKDLVHLKKVSFERTFSLCIVRLYARRRANCVLQMNFDTVELKDVPVDLTSTKPPSGRSRSIRKRKFETTEDLLKDQEAQKNKKAKIVEMEGPFWFEAGNVEINEKSEKVQHGITNRERQLLKEIVKSNF